MEINIFPTKSNLLASKSTLQFSKQGYDLLDKKRNILIRELVSLTETAKGLQKEINATFLAAHETLQMAAITHGASFAQRASGVVKEDTSVSVVVRSVMGAQIPKVVVQEDTTSELPYSLHSTSSLVDEVQLLFKKARNLTLQLAMIETAVYRLAINVSKTQKRANALKNIIIPKYEAIISFIQNSINEKEREEFGRLKMIKGH